MTGAGKDTLVKGKRSCTVLFFSAYFIYYAVYCVFSSFIVLFLTEQGYSATVCGIITSLTFLANLLMEPVGGYITDTFLPTRRYLLVCIGIVSMVCAFCTKFMNQSWLLLPGLVLSAGLAYPFSQLMDAWVNLSKESYPGLIYSRIRAGGSMVFAGMSGSALADAGGLGTIEVSAMSKAGYDPDFSVAVTAASAGIGPIIPPSINFVVWAFLSQTSTLAMFQADMGPGVLMGVAMMIWIPIAVKTQHIACPRAPKASWGERFHSLYTSLPALGGPAILVLGIMTGIFTPTECSVVAAMYCVILAICLKRFSFKMLTKALKDTLASAGMSMCLCATGLVFNWVIVTSGLIGFMTTLLMSLGNKIIILLVLNAMLLFLGCFIGSMQILIMVAPLLMNLATALGMSYVQMGVMAVLNVTLGLITPPMAPALFVTAKATGNKFETALKYTVQFLIPMFITLMITTFWEPLTMFLPRLLGSM